MLKLCEKYFGQQGRQWQNLAVSQMKCNSPVWLWRLGASLAWLDCFMISVAVKGHPQAGRKGAPLTATLIMKMAGHAM